LFWGFFVLFKTTVGFLQIGVKCDWDVLSDSISRQFPQNNNWWQNGEILEQNVQRLIICIQLSHGLYKHSFLYKFTVPKSCCPTHNF